MNKSLVFSVRGTPRPQPRPRFVNGRVVSTANPHAKLWRLAVDRAVREAISDSGRAKPLFAGAVRMRCIFTFAPPPGKEDRIGQLHTCKPDGDNLGKLVLDVMESAGVFRNDSQVGSFHPEKYWSSHVGVSVVVEDASEERRADPSAAVESVPDWLSA